MLCPTFLPRLWLTWQHMFCYLTRFRIFSSSAFFFLNINWLILCDNFSSVSGSTFPYICIFHSSAGHFLSAGHFSRKMLLTVHRWWHHCRASLSFSESEKTFFLLTCSSLVFALTDQIFHPGYFSALRLSRRASIRMSKVPCFRFSQALALFRPLNLFPTNNIAFLHKRKQERQLVEVDKLLGMNGRKIPIFQAFRKNATMKNEQGYPTEVRMRTAVSHMIPQPMTWKIWVCIQTYR